MTAEQNSIPAPAAEQSITLSLAPADLATLPGQQLVVMYDALRAASDAINGVRCQPRSRAQDRSPGGEMLAELAEWFDLALDKTAQAAVARKSPDRKDAAYCAWVILKEQVAAQDDLDDFAIAAGHLAFGVRAHKGAVQ